MVLVPGFTGPSRRIKLVAAGILASRVILGLGGGAKLRRRETQVFVVATPANQLRVLA